MTTTAQTKMLETFAADLATLCGETGYAVIDENVLIGLESLVAKIEGETDTYRYTGTTVRFVKA